MMTFSHLANRIASGPLSETEIDEMRRFCASFLFTLNELLGKLTAEAALWLTEHRSEYKSYAEAERAWEAKKHGQEMILIKYRIRGVEALSDALEGAWFLRQREWKEAGRER